MTLHYPLFRRTKAFFYLLGNSPSFIKILSIKNCIKYSNMFEIKNIPIEKVTFSIDYKTETSNNSFNLKDFEELSRQFTSEDQSPDEGNDSNNTTSTINQQEASFNVSQMEQDHESISGQQQTDNFKDQFNMFTNLASKFNARKNNGFSKNRKLNIFKLANEVPKCDVCGKIFKDRKYIHNHKRFVHGTEKYDCDQCDYSTKQKVMLKYHKEAKHSGVTFDCKLCDYKACRPYNLTEHIKNVHENVQYNCTQCDYSAKRPETLNHHIKAVHENNYKFSCDKCQYKCMQQNRMAIHIASVHEKIKHDCSQCDFKSTSKASLKLHFKSLHLGIRHYCDECTYKATSIGGLNKHKKIHHKN